MGCFPWRRRCARCSAFHWTACVEWLQVNAFRLRTRASPMALSSEVPKDERQCQKAKAGSRLLGGVCQEAHTETNHIPHMKDPRFGGKPIVAGRLIFQTTRQALRSPAASPAEPSSTCSARFCPSTVPGSSSESCTGPVAELSGSGERRWEGDDRNPQVSALIPCEAENQQDWEILPRALVSRCPPSKQAQNHAGFCQQALSSWCPFNLNSKILISAFPLMTFIASEVPRPYVRPPPRRSARFPNPPRPGPGRQLLRLLPRGAPEAQLQRPPLPGLASEPRGASPSFMLKTERRQKAEQKAVKTVC